MTDLTELNRFLFPSWSCALCVVYNAAAAHVLVSKHWCLTSTETIRLIRDGEKGEEGAWGGGGAEREIICLSLHCHHQNDFCIMMGSDVRAILMFQS